MADEQQVQTQQAPSVSLGDTLRATFWGDEPAPTQQQPPTQEQQQPEGRQQPATVQTQPEVKTKEEEILEPKEWLKREFEVDDASVLKQQLKEYQELKAKVTPQPELKFENEVSQQLFSLIKEGKTKEVLKVLQQQDELERYTSAEVNKESADNIIKLGMKMKYPSLTEEQINFQFNEDYAIPKKPVQKSDELDDEYTDRLAEWEGQVQRIEMKKTIAATMAIPDLQKMKSEIKLPTIESSSTFNKEPTKEEIEAFEKSKNSFLQSSQSFINDFSGFNVAVKDKDVDYKVAYTPSKEEKEMITEGFKQFAETGFDANVLFAQRWVNEDKSLNIQQMVKDYLRIISGEKADAKFVTESANQRLELYLKEKKQINLNGNQQQGTFTPDQNKTRTQILQEQFWGSS